MNIESKQVDTEYVIKLSGRFEFHTQKDFRESYTPALKNEDIKTITLNMLQVEYLDSSALGMLLLLKASADMKNKNIIISAASNKLMEIFEIANFNHLFKMV